MGISTDEAAVTVSTPFDCQITNVAPTDRQFSTIGAPDRVSINYAVSKDSIINAFVQRNNGEAVATILKSEPVLGVISANAHSFSWRGNYPDPDSGLMADPGAYKIILNIAARDGSGSKQLTVDGIDVRSFQTNASLANLQPIGKEVEFHNGYGLEKIRLAVGDSPYYFEAKGSGLYYPPKDLNYTITATGKQRILAYPYVPFAALMHRGFNSVDVQVDVTATVHYTKYGYVFLQGWKGEGQSKIRQHSQIFSLSKTMPTVEIKQKYDILDFHDAALRGVGEPEGHIDKIDFTLVFRPAKDPSWILDIVTIEADPRVNSSLGQVLYPITMTVPTLFGGTIQVPTTTDDPVLAATYLGAQQVAMASSGVQKYINGDPKISEKGIFNVIPTWGTEGRNFGRSPYFSLSYALEAPIAYSRLTNRFVPWFGFVNKLRPANEAQNFSGYLDRLDKLGFPGKSYFIGSTATSANAPHKKSFDTNLFSGNTGELLETVSGAARPKVSEIESKANSGMSGTASDYTVYLSDEYIEFVPITTPQDGGYEYNGSQINGTLALSSQSSYPITAKTSLAYAGKGEDSRISPFEFSWPWNEAEYSGSSGFIKQQENKRKTLDKALGGDPQKYTGTTWDPAGSTGTFWELAPTELAERRLNANNINTAVKTGQTHYDKSAGRSKWDGTQSLGQLLFIPAYVNDPVFSLASNTSGISIFPTTGNTNSYPRAEDTTAALAWTTEEDVNLGSSSGQIKSPWLTFNEQAFQGFREIKISGAYNISGDYQSAAALKYTFLKYDRYNNNGETPVDNPDLVIQNWQVSIKDRTDGANKDLKLERVNLNGKRLDDTFTLKLDLKASESRYVELSGAAPDAYELMFFDGKDWKTIYQSNEGKTGRLAWWNVSRLNGKYTVLLKSAGLIATTDINVGTLVSRGGGDAYSTYKRAQLKFPAGAFVNGSRLPQDQLVTITPVTMSEIKIRNRPIIMTHGPIVEIKPSPWKFIVSSSEGVEQRPTLRFLYTFDELKKLEVWDGTGTPSNIPWNIHQVTAAGDLQIVSGNNQAVEENNGEMQYAFYAPLDHFSTYALLNGKFSLSAPIVLASSYITNQDTVTIYGTAEPGSILTIYVKTDNVVPDPEKAEPHFGRITAEARTGNYRFENIQLLREGENYIFVTSHLGEDKNVRTYSDVTIVKDTIPPSVEATQNLYAFSPNGDGKYDTVDFTLKSNEQGKINLQLTTDNKQLLNVEISAEAEKEVKLNWAPSTSSGSSFRIYRRDNLTGLPAVAGQWTLFSEIPINEKLSDGAYNTTVYAIDEAGNISNNLISQTIIDTTPPTILSLDAVPNPFTPNNDGVKDTTKFSYKLSEPAYVSQSILRDDGKLFRSHEEATDKFVYPTLFNRDVQSQVPSAGQWQWDGRGSRNELIGGTYTYSILAEDNVGNVVTSEVKQIVVDREPTLVPYAYAEPDPFAPVNPGNSFTEIKYYLGRDNLSARVWVVGQEGKVLKTLVQDETQGKGEHAARWYGDFNQDYDGPTAAGNKYRVADGSYEFKVHAEDITEPGAKAAEVSNTILVDNVPPHIIIKDLLVDYAKKTAKLTYSIPENASVEVSVYEENGVLAASLV
ncbi:MAG: hypothetical protein WCT39_04520, partial [Candidatus Margulisiibacteriota bacterium]